jgi:hypothetical protein
MLTELTEGAKKHEELNIFYPILTYTQFMAAQINNFQMLSHLFIFLSNLFAEHLEMFRGALGAPRSTVWEYLL